MNLLPNMHVWYNKHFHLTDSVIATARFWSIVNVDNVVLIHKHKAILIAPWWRAAVHKVCIHVLCDVSILINPMANLASLK